MAKEVKNLAAQARSATEQIGQEIAGMRTISGEVVDGLSSIRRSIETVQEQVGSTAAAVNEQSVVATSLTG